MCSEAKMAKFEELVEEDNQMETDENFDPVRQNKITGRQINIRVK